MQRRAQPLERGDIRARELPRCHDEEGRLLLHEGLFALCGFGTREKFRNRLVTRTHQILRHLERLQRELVRRDEHEDLPRDSLAATREERQQVCEGFAAPSLRMHCDTLAREDTRCRRTLNRERLV